MANGVTARLSRREQGEAARAAVLRAARAEFLAAGYHGAGLDRIAAAAGFTKGAVYSRFAGKADLFLALLEERVAARAAANEALATTVEGPDGVAALAVRWADTERAELAWTLLVLEFRVHAARHPELNARYKALHERTIDGIEGVLATVLHRDGAAVRSLARRLFAMGQGIAVEQAVERRAFTPEVVARTVRAIVQAELGGGR